MRHMQKQASEHECMKGSINTIINHVNVLTSTPAFFKYPEGETVSLPPLVYTTDENDAHVGLYTKGPNDLFIACATWWSHFIMESNVMPKTLINGIDHIIGETGT